jgi:hypothetical protein
MRTLLFLMTIGVVFVVVNGIIQTPGKSGGGQGLTDAQAQAALGAQAASRGSAVGNTAGGSPASSFASQAQAALDRAQSITGNLAGIQPLAVSDGKGY